MSERERKDQRRALLREKAGVDFTLMQNGKVLRSRKSYTSEEWADHLEEQKRRLEIRLKAASPEAERTEIRRELRSWRLMEKYTNVDFRRETR